MRAAIYARRSTEEHQAASLDVQLGEARRYIAARGWTLEPAHVFIDDAVSRAEFKKRAGLMALLNAAASRSFDVVVARDESRIGGDTYRTGIVIQDMLDHGVRLFYYFTDEEVRLDGAIEKFLVAARAFAAELEREKTSQRTHEHLMTKARRGLNVGGRVYGYENIEIKEGDRRVRVEYRIHEGQAEIVREIFRRYAGGEGLKTIAKALNARGVPAPRAGRRGVGSWCPGSISPMLHRERYRGVLVWGKKEKTYRGGTKVRVSRPEAEWIRVEAAELRIVDEELWSAVQARAGEKKRYGRERASGARPRYLLSGFSRCGACGGRIQVVSRRAGKATIKVYVCANHRERGTCANAMRRPVEEMDAAVLGWIQEHVITEEVVGEVVREVRRRLMTRAAAGAGERERVELGRQVAQLRREIQRLGEAIVSTKEAPHALVRMMGEREHTLVEIENRIAALNAPPDVMVLDARRIEKEGRIRLADVRGLMQHNPEKARIGLAALLPKPLKWLPETAL